MARPMTPWFVDERPSPLEARNADREAFEQWLDEFGMTDDAFSHDPRESAA